MSAFRGDSDIVADMRRDGYATLTVDWPVRPADVFARFADLVDSIDTAEGIDGLAAVDAALAASTAGNPRHATSLLSNVRHATQTELLYGHSYFKGTLAAIERECHLPMPVAALWRSLEEIFGVIDGRFRHALGALDDLHRMPSALRVWKYVYHDRPWCSDPHYDASIFSALVASQNPDDELLRVGLEGNGVPIELVQERVERLRQLTPTPDRCWIFPGVFSNRWGFEPTWHYVRQLPRPSACRYSLIWGLVHPDGLPVTMSPHISQLTRVANRGSL